MSTYRLENLFEPRSVALVGASPREGSLGKALLANLRDGGFPGALHLVNPHHREIEGRPCVASLAAIGSPVDVVIIATPKATVPGLIDEAGRLGCRVAIIITAGFDRGPGSTEELIAQTARKYGLRIVGPNCLGVIAPEAKFDASFAATPARLGDLALISQSGAIAASLLEWASAARRGLLRHRLAGRQDRRRFRRLPRLFRAGPGHARHPALCRVHQRSPASSCRRHGPRRAPSRSSSSSPAVTLRAPARRFSHTGALAGSDAVFDAAFRRAGLLRVYDLDELFAAVETLSRVAPFPGRPRRRSSRMAAGSACSRSTAWPISAARLATLSPATMRSLRRAIARRAGRPATRSTSSATQTPHATRARCEAILADDGNDAVLVMNCPTALASSIDGAAQAVAEAVKSHRAASFKPKPVFTVWLGDSRQDRRRSSTTARIPSFGLETDAVQGIMHLVAYRKAQDLLMEMPPSLPAGFSARHRARPRARARTAREGRALARSRSP